MTAFVCKMCQKCKDQVEHNFLTKDCKVDVCDPCMKTMEDNKDGWNTELVGMEREEKEVQDLYGGSMK